MVDEGHAEGEHDPEEELRKRLSLAALSGIHASSLVTFLEAAVAGSAWRVAGHRVVRSPEIAAAYEVAVLHDPTTRPGGHGGPLWALVAFAIQQPFANMTSEQRADRLENASLDVGTPDQLVPWLMPPDLSFSHLLPEHPIHRRSIEAGPALWNAHPRLGWSRLRELSALVVLLEVLRATEPDQADAMDLLVARHPQGSVVSDYRRAVSVGRTRP